VFPSGVATIAENLRAGTPLTYEKLPAGEKSSCVLANESSRKILAAIANLKGNRKRGQTRYRNCESSKPRQDSTCVEKNKCKKINENKENS
jgi:hypothetical protein